MVDTPQSIAGMQSGYFQDAQPNFSIVPSRQRNFVQTLQKRTPELRSTDPEFGAIGDGSTHPLSGIAAFATATSPAGLAAITVGGNTPYSWATNALYGLTFTKTTSAATVSGTTVTLGTAIGSGLAGDLQNPANYLVSGMGVTGTNIPANTTISAITFTSGTPNKIDGPLAGTFTLSNAVTGGGITNGQTLTFSYTSALMQALEMDWVGIQAAEYAAGLPANGQRHRTPAGTYILNRAIVRSDTPVGQYLTHQSSWMGDGMIATFLTWPADLGWGTWAVTPPDRYSPGNLAFSDMQQMTLFGPGVGSTMGATTCKMHGLAVNVDFVAIRVMCQGFYSGLNITADHQYFINCYFQNNYHGVYFAPYAAQNTGDQSFTDCHMDGNKFASVCVSGTNQIVAATFIRCHTGFSPYCFYKETGSITNFIINSTFIRTSQEAFGNGCYWDENAAGLISGCVWQGCDMALDTTNTYEITANSTFAAMYVGNMSNCQFFGEVDPYTQGYNRGTHPYTLGIIVAQQGLANMWFSNAATLVLVGTSTFPAVRSAFAVVGCDIRWDSGQSRGTFRTCSGALTAGVFVGMTNFGTAIAINATNPFPIGLNVYAISGSIASALAAVTYDGIATVNKTNTTDVITAGKAIQINSTTDGSVVTYSSGNIVGIVWNATGSSDTTLIAELSLRGP